MSVDPRAALDRLLAALEAHFVMAARGNGEDDPALDKAAATLVDAFETYDDALFEAFGVDTPLYVYDDDDEDEGEDDVDEDDFDDDPEAGDDDFVE